ncbi:MAG: hypothetical protein JKY52_20150 [Flavobacteriales bacterium]|nr:hypothetical protein [Flavobacteriales bacterium]
MRKNYKLKLFTALVVTGVSFGSVNAFNPNPNPTIIITENSDIWVEVQNERGIKVSFTSYQLDDNFYLKIRFENLTNENLRFVWSLTNKDAKILINKYVNQVDSNKSIDFTDLTMPILIGEGETVKDFSITVNTQ